MRIEAFQQEENRRIDEIRYNLLHDKSLLDKTLGGSKTERNRNKKIKAHDLLMMNVSEKTAYLKKHKKQAELEDQEAGLNKL